VRSMELMAPARGDVGIPRGLKNILDGQCPLRLASFSPRGSKTIGQGDGGRGMAVPPPKATRVLWGVEPSGGTAPPCVLNIFRVVFF
jgi:hypothetical protein